MKKTVIDLREMKQRGEKISFITGYDYMTAKYEEQAGIDMILVGDSLGNVLLGYESTIPATMEEMIIHAKAVRRGAPNTFIVGDMPFMSYQVSNEKAIENACRFIKEAGCDCIKLEGADSLILDRIRAISGVGILVMGHLGLTPQFTAKLGGCKAQGRTFEAAKAILEQAKAVEKAGAFAVLIEGVPAIVGKLIRDNLTIPVLGIGAGSYMDGQLLIYADMLGLYEDFTPKFVKKYANIGQEIKNAFTQYHNEIKNGSFPVDKEHSYKIKDDEAQKIHNEFFAKK